MRAVVVRELVKSVSELSVSTVPRLAPPASGMVKVDVVAAGVNFFDGLAARGKYQLQPPLPFVPGAEFSGVVSEVGDAVSGFSPGDRVFGGNAFGCFAEEVCVPAQNVRHMPDALPFDAAAGIFITMPTAYAGLVLRGGLTAGDTCLVHAGAGGVGAAAVSIARALGATVIATASSDAKLEVARAAGAHHVVNYSTDAWVDEVKALTDGAGVNCVFDPVGLATDSTKVMAWGGRYVVIGFAGFQAPPSIKLNRILLKNIAFTGLHWGAYALHEPESIEPVWSALTDLLTDGSVTPVLYDKQYTLDGVADAMEAIEARKTYGKVVVHVAPGSRL